MIAVSLRSGMKPAVLRSLKKSVLPASYRALASRPLSPRMVAYQDEAREGAPQKTPQRALDRQLARHDPFMGFTRLPTIFNEMQREMDSLTRAFGFMEDDAPLLRARGPLSRVTRAALPSMYLETDVAESENAWTIKADVPGMSKADIKLQLQEGVLTISGERCEEKKAPEKEQSEEGEASKGTEAAASPLRIERRYGAFVRSFSLPEHADADGINASVKDGVLTIVIPKRPETTPSVKDIPIA